MQSTIYTQDFLLFIPRLSTVSVQSQLAAMILLLGGVITLISVFSYLQNNKIDLLQLEKKLLLFLPAPTLPPHQQGKWNM